MKQDADLQAALYHSTRLFYGPDWIGLCLQERKLDEDLDGRVTVRFWTSLSPLAWDRHRGIGARYIISIWGGDDGGYQREFEDEETARRCLVSLPYALSHAVLCALGFGRA